MTLVKMERSLCFLRRRSVSESLRIERQEEDDPLIELGWMAHVNHEDSRWLKDDDGAMC